MPLSSYRFYITCNEDRRWLRLANG